MKGIMFSDELIPMVLDGSKTMTRRIMKDQPGSVRTSLFVDSGIEDNHGRELKPRYREGETVYVKEAWSVVHRLDSFKQSELTIMYGGAPLKIDYCADGVHTGIRRNKMFMPEWASRCKLKITGVRAERLQDISEDDAVKEGCESTAVPNSAQDNYLSLYARENFEQLIDRINGPGTWDSNPWCWVYEFRRVS